MPKISERFFEDRVAMQNSLLANTTYQLEKAIQLKGEATLMLSGGSTPKPLYQKLSEQQLAWQRINVGMVDERWVSARNEASNETFIRLNLLRNLKRKPNFLAMKTEDADHFEAAEKVNSAYSTLSSPFDLTILGMGNDGHTASLFPNAFGLEQALESRTKLCAAIQAEQSEVTGVHTKRMTLTLNALTQSKLIKLLLVGKDKLATYRKALEGNDIHEMPVRALFQQNHTPVVVYWAP